MRKYFVWGGTLIIPVGCILSMMTNPSVSQLGFPMIAIGAIGLVVGAIMNVRHGNRRKGE